MQKSEVLFYLKVGRLVCLVRSMKKRKVRQLFDVLLPHDMNFLSEIDLDYSFTGKSAVALIAGMLVGRLHGGVALLWRSSIFRNESVIECDCDRICTIKPQTVDLREILFI